MTVQEEEAGRVSDRHEILGLTLDVMAPATVIDRFMELVRQGARGYCCVANVHQCVLVHDNPAFRERVNAASMVVTDSTILQLAVSGRTGVRLPPPLRGAELMLELCRCAERDSVPIALIGGRDEAALDALCDRLARDYPGLDIAYRWSPPFRELTDREARSMRDAIRRTGARAVSIGIGCPKQEIWMSNLTNELDAMLIGVGAAFDQNAGIVRGSPPWVHRSGLEWLYRLLAEPSRLWRRYLTTSPRFIWLLAIDALVGKRLNA